MKAPAKPRILTVLSALIAAAACGLAGGAPGWQDLSKVGEARTRGTTAFWGGLPELNPKARITVLDVDGPGVVTSFHVSAMAAGGLGFGSAPVAGLILRVFYDGQPRAAIDMPLMDFVGDIECKSQYFTSVFMSKVKESHNFRMPMPFRKHVTIEVENPSDVKVTGYIELTYDALDAMPAECGTLRADYRTGGLSAQTTNTLFKSGAAGVIVAHWLQYETDKALDGQLICEADQQFFLDGDARPTLQSMGSEDLYGGSWGFIEPQGDSRYTSVLRHETLGATGSRIAVLRCRSRDAISFRKSCKWVLTWANDGWAATALGAAPIPYRHCVYYYSTNSLAAGGDQVIAFALGLTLAKHPTDAPFADTATASSGLAVAYSSDNTNVATVAADGTVTLTGLGIARIHADQAGDDNWNAAPRVSQTLIVGLAVARLRPDYVTNTFSSGQSAGFADALGTGTWTFYDASTEAHASFTAQLTYSTASQGVHAGNSFGDHGETVNWLPGVSSAQLTVGAGEGSPNAANNELAIHPGSATTARQYLVLRWTAGSDVSGPLTVAGNVRKLTTNQPSPADGITFATYINGSKSGATTTIANTDGTGYTFNLTGHSISPGQSVDFVIGPNGNWNGDNSAISATIIADAPPRGMLLMAR